MQRCQPILAVFTALTFLVVAPAWAQEGMDAAPLRIVAFGDSLVAGLGVSPSDSFPEQLEVALTAEGYAVEVANAGVSGDTTAGGLARLDWSVPEGADLVIVELGANDALRGIAPASVEANLDAILARLSERDGRVLLAGMMAPPNMGAAYAQEFNAIYPRLAQTHGVALYPFFLDGVAAEAALNQADAMHPNAEGVAAIVERMLPAVTRELDAIRRADAPTRRGERPVEGGTAMSGRAVAATSNSSQRNGQKSDVPLFGFDKGGQSPAEWREGAMTMATMTLSFPIP